MSPGQLNALIQGLIAQIPTRLKNRDNSPAFGFANIAQLIA